MRTLRSRASRPSGVHPVVRLHDLVDQFEALTDDAVRSFMRHTKCSRSEAMCLLEKLLAAPPKAIGH